VENWLYGKQFQLMSNEPKMEWNFKNFSDRHRDTCFDIPQNGTELFVQLPERVEISSIRIIFRNPEHFQRMEIFVDDRTCHFDSKLPGEAVHLNCSQQPIGNRIKIQIWITQLQLAICDIQAYASKMRSQLCGIPPAPLNGYIRNETAEEFKFFCDSKFHLNGSDTTRCVDGRWSSETPKCVSINGGCAALPNLQNGHIAYDTSPVENRYPKSTTATNFCSDRYNLNGNGSRYCRDDGTWSGVDSFCQCEVQLTHNLQPSPNCPLL
jgi:Sushi repeat (SCR repeat)